MCQYLKLAASPLASSGFAAEKFQSSWSNNTKNRVFPDFHPVTKTELTKKSLAKSVQPFRRR